MPVEPDDPTFQAEDGTSLESQPVQSDTKELGAADKPSTVGDALSELSSVLDIDVPAKPEDSKPEGKTGEDTHPDARDFTGLDEEEIPYFRKMGNAAFAYFKPRYLNAKTLQEENEKLKKNMEVASKASFFDHPEAYRLTPEYQDCVQQRQISSFEIDHWRQCLAAIRAGEKVSVLTGYDQQGQPIYSQPLDPDASLEADVTNALIKANANLSRAQDKAESLKTSFSAQHKTFVADMDKVRGEIFKGVDPTKLEKASKAKLSMFPAYLHGRPEIQTIASLLAVIDGYSMLLEKRRAQNVTQTAKARTATNGGPRTAKLQGGAGKSNTVGSVLDEFERAQQRGVF